MLISDLALLLRVRAREAPSFLLERAVRESAREFFRLSRTWRLDFVGAVTPGTNAYDLTLPTGALAFDILYAKLQNLDVNLAYLRDAAKAYLNPDNQYRSGENSQYITLLDTDTFQLIPDLKFDDVIEMKVVLQLQRDALDIPDDIVEEFEEVIMHGALYRLYDMPGETWSSDRKAVMYNNKFLIASEQARLRIEETATPGGRTAAFSW